MKNYQIYDFGKFNDVAQHTFAPEGTPINIPGKLFLKDRVGLTSMEVSVNVDKPGTGMNFFHRHHGNEELYIFISGRGEMSIDGEQIPVAEGSVVSINPEAKRAWWNTGGEDLHYIVIQAPKGGFPGTSIGDGEVMEGKVPWEA